MGSGDVNCRRACEQRVGTSNRGGMLMQRVGFLAIVVVVTGATACGTAAGGGWIPSAGNPTKKATFGFEYTCDSSTSRLQGHLTYHDHGTGHKVIAEIDQPVPAEFSCNTFVAGVTSACGVVKNGSGGVSVNDIALVAAADGKPAATTDSLAIVLFTGGTTTLTACNGAAQGCSTASSPEEFILCLAGSTTGNVYYSNVGDLGGGNITWTE